VPAKSVKECGEVFLAVFHIQGRRQETDRRMRERTFVQQGVTMAAYTGPFPVTLTGTHNDVIVDNKTFSGNLVKAGAISLLPRRRRRPALLCLVTAR
jgi:hypothetical protein